MARTNTYIAEAIALEGETSIELKITRVREHGPIPLGNSSASTTAQPPQELEPQIDIVFRGTVALEIAPTLISTLHDGTPFIPSITVLDNDALAERLAKLGLRVFLKKDISLETGLERVDMGVKLIPPIKPMEYLATPVIAELDEMRDGQPVHVQDNLDAYRALEQQTAALIRGYLGEGLTPKDLQQPVTLIAPVHEEGAACHE